MFTNIAQEFGNNVYYPIIGYSVLYKSIRSIWLWYLSSAFLIYLIYQILREIYLKYLAMVVDLSIVSYSFVNFYFKCFEASFLGAQNLKFNLPDKLKLYHQKGTILIFSKAYQQFGTAFAWHIFFSFIFSESLCFRCVSCKEYIVEFNFLVQS